MQIINNLFYLTNPDLMYHRRIHVKCYDGERYLPECLIERYSERTEGFMAWYENVHRRKSKLIRILGHVNNKNYISEGVIERSRSFPSRMS